MTWLLSCTPQLDYGGNKTTLGPFNLAPGDTGVFVVGNVYARYVTLVMPGRRCNHMPSFSSSCW